MSNARANAAVYDQRRRKLKKRNKRYFQRIMIALIAFYAICLTSKMWLKNNYKNIDITPIGSVVSQNNREVTLISWSYCRDERKMEVLLGISNTAYDGNDGEQYFYRRIKTMLIKNQNYGEQEQEIFTIFAHYQNCALAYDEEENMYVHVGDLEAFPIGTQAEKSSFVRLEKETLQNDSLYERLNAYAEKINLGANNL